MSAKKRTADKENDDSDKRTKLDEFSQEDKISISVDDDDLNLSPGYHLKVPSPGRTSEHSRDSFRGNYSDAVEDSDGFQLSKQTSSDKRAGRKYRSAKDRDLDREDNKPQSDRSRRSDDRKSSREKPQRSDEGRKSRDVARDSRRSNEQQHKLPPSSSNRQRHSDQRSDEQKRRTLDVRRHKERERERSREDDRWRQGRGIERRLSPMPGRRRDNRPHRSRSPRERRPREDRPRDEHLQRQYSHSRNRSLEKKEEITSTVPSDEEALDKLAQEVDKELAQRGISPKVPMATVDISSSDNGSSDEDDVSEEEETKGEDDSQRHNTEDGELAESDETSMTESDDEDDSPHRGPVIKSRMLRKAISGYGEGESDASSSPDQPRQRSVTPPPAVATPEDTPVDEKTVAEPLVEETVSTPPIDPNLPPYYPALYGCRNVEEYEWLNRIEEGTYGVVYRAKDKRTGEVVALKKLKMEKEKEGFPITSLREINTLLKSHHPNIINVREVVFSKVDKIFIVMDYVEHDLKSLMETMKQPFLEGEVKTLLRQLLSAVEHLHDNWILHRDIKTSNLLLGHNGILRVGDFGLAREYGSPLKGYTPVVVTLWYRAPELLLGAKEYSTAIDIWSVGCVFAEMLLHKALFKGKSEIDQLNQIFKELGTPNDKIWPGYSELPCVKKVSFKEQPFNNLRKKFPYLTKCGFDLLNRFLTYDPKKRITAEDALAHEYFKETPLPVDPSMFPTWPAKSELAALKKDNAKEKSPSAPEGGAFLKQVKEDDPVGGFRLTTAMHGQAAVGQGFSLRF